MMQEPSSRATDGYRFRGTGSGRNAVSGLGPGTLWKIDLT
jgi:hypothetical protein